MWVDKLHRSKDSVEKGRGSFFKKGASPLYASSDFCHPEGDHMDLLLSIVFQFKPSLIYDRI